MPAIQILNIVDAKIDADVTVMSADEFAKKIEESKRQFVVNINDNLKVFDVDTMVINKKIQDATKALNEWDYKAVKTILAGVPDDILSVARLRFLADLKVTNEQSLVSYKGYIENNLFKNVVKLADEQTKATYLKLAQHCREQYDAEQRIQAEIKEVEKLLSVKLYQEAIAYTKEMCRKYPYTMMSWKYACEVKYQISSNYNCNLEYSMMQKCPDYSEYNLPKCLQDKFSEHGKCMSSYKYAIEDYTKALGRLATRIWIAAASLLIFSVCMELQIRAGTSPTPSDVPYLLYLLVYLVSLVTGIAFIVYVIKSIRQCSDVIFEGKYVRKKRKAYIAACNHLPESAKITPQNYTTDKQKYSQRAVALGIAALVIGIVITVNTIMGLVQLYN